MRISRELLDELVAHALEEPHNEVCGVVAVEAAPPPAGGVQPAEEPQPRALRVFRAENLHASPLRFEIAPKELLALSNACDELGALGAIYHSHVRSDPYPSQTDINYAANWPGVEWIIVGLATAGQPDVRSYLIERGQVREVTLAHQ
jgi:[CysO sulfur-carrier protein]-S-L-cysteine hydrolase